MPVSSECLFPSLECRHTYFFFFSFHFWCIFWRCDYVWREKETSSWTCNNSIFSFASSSRDEIRAARHERGRDGWWGRFSDATHTGGREKRQLMFLMFQLRRGVQSLDNAGKWVTSTSRFKETKFTGPNCTLHSDWRDQWWERKTTPVADRMRERGFEVCEQIVDSGWVSELQSVENMWQEQKHQWVE